MTLGTHGMDAASSPARAIPERLASLVAAAQEEAEANAAGFQWDPTTGLRAPASPLQRRDQRRLNVLLTKGGKPLFRFLQDERVQVFSAEQTATPAPDLVVITRPEQLVEDPTGLDLSGDTWARLRSGAAKLVIDSSGEGHYYDAEQFLGIHDALERSGVKASDCIYITQNRRFRAEYLSDRRARGLLGPAIEVLVHDRYIQYLCGRVGDDGPAIFEERLAAYASARPARGRRFVCLNNKFRPVRMLFLLRLLKGGLWDSGHISLGRLDEADGRPAVRSRLLRRMAAIEELKPLTEELAPLFDELEAYSPRYIGLGEGQGGVAPRWGGDKEMIVPEMFDEYVDSWFSIVTETDFYNGLLRITEKVFKPLLCFHPLVVVGSCDCLRLVREYGFKTFSGVWDEGYDQETDPRSRFDMVYELVERLCRMPEPELARLCEAAEEVVVFNALWGLTRLPALFRDRIDAALIDRLAVLVHGEQKDRRPA